MDGVAPLPLPISDGERLRRNALPAAFFFIKRGREEGWGLGAGAAARAGQGDAQARMSLVALACNPLPNRNEISKFRC